MTGPAIELDLIHGTPTQAPSLGSSADLKLSAVLRMSSGSLEDELLNAFAEMLSARTDHHSSGPAPTEEPGSNARGGTIPKCVQGVVVHDLKLIDMRTIDQRLLRLDWRAATPLLKQQIYARASSLSPRCSNSMRVQTTAAGSSIRCWKEMSESWYATHSRLCLGCPDCVRW